MRAGKPLAVLAAGLVLAAGIPLAWMLSRPAPDAGDVPDSVSTPPPVAATLSPPAAPRPAAVEPGGRARSAGKPAAADSPTAATAPRPATRSARLADQPSRAAVPPTQLRIPDLAVDAPIEAVGLEAGGGMAVPADVTAAGWYRHGPAPGESGATVIAAHVDSAAQGRGVFFDLRRLSVGAQLVVTDADGREHGYRVTARRRYPKTTLPTDELFARAGEPRLVLVTCGGEFDRTAGTYRDNVVVFAESTAAGASG